MDQIDKEFVFKTANILHEMLDDFMTKLDSWDDIYQVLNESIALMGTTMSTLQEGGRPSKEIILPLTVGSLFLKGYAKFRLHQPTMTDLELAKVQILYHAHNDIGDAMHKIPTLDMSKVAEWMKKPS
jgi:hypothetical protein